MEGQAGFEICVTAVDQTGRNANNISSDRPAGGVDRVRVEPEGCDDGGNVGGSQPVPLGFVDRNIGEDYGRSVEVAQGRGGGGGWFEGDDCKSADFGVAT